jgi:hypothetical protein
VFARIKELVVTIGTVRAAVAGVDIRHDLMCATTFSAGSRRPLTRDDSVAFFVAFTEFSTGSRVSRSDEATSSTIFVADPGARVADDLGK